MKPLVKDRLCMLMSVGLGLMTVLGCGGISIDDSLVRLLAGTAEDVSNSGSFDDSAGRPNSSDDGSSAESSSDDQFDDHGSSDDDSAESNEGQNDGGSGGNVRLRARLRGTGAESGNADYRLESDRERFKVEVQHFDPGVYDILVNGALTGQISVGPLGTAEVEFDTKTEPGHVSFPDAFPDSVQAGDVIDVAGIVSGELILD